MGVFMFLTGAEGLKQALKRSVLGAVFALLLGILPAQSATYQFNFQSDTLGDLTASGIFSVDAFGQISNISGSIGGTASLPTETIAGVVALGDSNVFNYDNHFDITFPHFSSQGLVFTTGTGALWNLWFGTNLFDNDSTNDNTNLYWLHKFLGVNGPFNEFLDVSGTLKVAETPLPGALVLFLTGLAGWGALGLRRRHKVENPALA